MRISRVPLLIPETAIINTEAIENFPEYDSNILDRYCPTGCSITFKGDWDKWQLVQQVQDYFLYHNLLAKRNARMFPISTTVYPIRTRNGPQTILYKSGISAIHAECGDPKNFQFISEYILQKVLREVKLLIEDTNCDKLEDLEELVLRKHKFIVSGSRDWDVRKLIKDVLDSYYSSVRLNMPIVDSVIEDLCPKLPRPLDTNLLTHSFLLQGDLSKKEFDKLVNLNATKHRLVDGFDSINWDESISLCQLIQKRIEFADIDIFDVTYYPDLLTIGELFESSPFNELHLVLASDGQQFHTEQEHLYHSDLVNRDPEDVALFLSKIEEILFESSLFSDVCDDLVSTELNDFEYSDDVLFGQISKFEILFQNNSLCITIRSYHLSCTLYIDLIAMHTVSAQLMTI